MAGNLDIGKGPSIVWKTEKALFNINRASSVFSLLGTSWKLQMELDYVSSNDSYSYRIYLHRVGSSRPKTRFSVITSVQSSGSMRDNYSFRSHSIKTHIIKDYTDVTPLWTCYTSIASKDITDFKKNAHVTVVCVFTDIPDAMYAILDETVELKTQTNFDRPLPVENIPDTKLSSDANLDILSDDFCKLLDEKVLPDINLRCGNRTIAAHKAILAARSEVFSAMFQSKMLESETGAVDIIDVDAHVLDMFLKYVYSGRLSDLSDEDLLCLYAAADKYAVNTLKRVCSERMIKSLSQGNCLNILLLANAHNDEDFKSAILDFVLNHMEILKSEEWTKFSRENSTLSNEVLQFVVQRKCF